MNGISDEYLDVRFTIPRDPKFRVDEIHGTISATYRKHTSK